MISAITPVLGAAARQLAGKPQIAPGLKPSKSMRKVGRLREKAAAASAAGKTKKAEKFTGRANKRASKENIKRAKSPGYVGIPYAKGKGNTVAM